MATLSNSPSRGKFLTIVLILSAISGLLNISQALNPASLASEYGTIPSWYTAVELLITALILVGVVGVWLWKKWGVYTYFLNYALVLFVAFYLLQGRATLSADKAATTQLAFMMVLAIVAVEISLSAWAVYRKWSNFS